MTTLLLPVGLVLGAVTMQAAQAGFNVTVEAPGVLNSTASFSSSGVETFDSQGTSASFTSIFGGSGITGTFNNAAISPANEYGGAGGFGNYVVDANGTFTMTVDSAITYFGLWISALNSTNDLDFYSGAT
ncbi:MAG: hypothetical protein H7251_04120, partial [Acetobacteraceae bacterium]|nr:hypothetical protein [Acetobacteraceae bacterium]